MSKREKLKSGFMTKSCFTFRMEVLMSSGVKHIAGPEWHEQGW